MDEKKIAAAEIAEENLKDIVGGTTLELNSQVETFKCPNCGVDLVPLTNLGYGMPGTCPNCGKAYIQKPGSVPVKIT